MTKEVRMRQMPLTVMVPTMGRPDLLRRTIQSLKECERPDNFEQVIVIENGIKCGARKIVEELREDFPLQYLFVEKPNKSTALNAALTLVDTGLIIFIDDDIRLSPTVLTSYVHAAREHPNCFFGGPFGVDYETSPPDWLTPYLPRSAKGWSLDNEKCERDTSQIFLGFNWAAFANHIRDTGGFNEQRGPNMPMTGQETDMQQRLLRMGYLSHYVANAWVWHFVPECRCNPEWAVERAARSTQAAVSSLGHKSSRFNHILNTIWWRFHPRLWFARFLAAIVRSDRSRFHADQWLARHRGALEALRTLRE